MSFKDTMKEISSFLGSNSPNAIRVVTEDPHFFVSHAFLNNVLSSGEGVFLHDDQISARILHKQEDGSIRTSDPATVDPRDGKNLFRNMMSAFDWAANHKPGSKHPIKYFILLNPVNVADAARDPVRQKILERIISAKTIDFLTAKNGRAAELHFPQIIIVDTGETISAIETKVRKFILSDLPNIEKCSFLTEEKKSIILKKEFREAPDFKGISIEGVLSNYRYDRNGIKELTDQNMKSEFFTLVEDMPAMSEVAGLVGVKQFIQDHKVLFQNLDKIHEEGIEAPRGILLTGIQGCGKSWVSKAIGHELGLPLFEFNLSRVLQGLVGSSEANMYAALKKLEVISPCIIFMDEIDKQVGGVASSNKSDGGTLLRVVGMFLTFLQESKSSVFLVGTSNNFDALPPELVSRLDEVFFVDLPERDEREDLIKLKVNDNRFDINYARLSNIEGLTGREIHKAVNYAKTLAFKRSVESGNEYVLTTDDLEGSLNSMTKLSETMAREIQLLKERLFGVAKTASEPYRNFEPEQTGGSTNIVEFGKKK